MQNNNTVAPHILSNNISWVSNWKIDFCGRMRSKEGQNRQKTSSCSVYGNKVRIPSPICPSGETISPNRAAFYVENWCHSPPLVAPLSFPITFLSCLFSQKLEEMEFNVLMALVVITSPPSRSIHIFWPVNHCHLLLQRLRKYWFFQGGIWELWLSICSLHQNKQFRGYFYMGWKYR